MQKVLIVDPSEDWQIILAQALGRDYQVECCADGNRALQLLRDFRPDVLILELMLTGTDGVGVLQAASNEKLLPATLVTGRYFSDFLLNTLGRYAVDYVSQKPCSVGSLVDRVHELAALAEPKQIRPASPGDLVANALLSLGVIPSQSGFHYLREGILLKARDPRVQLTKHLYPAIGEPCGVNGAAVEKAIRTAISSAYRRRNDAVWRIYFTPDPDGQIPKPTAGQFITRLAEALLQQERMKTG